jgi:nucleoside 2-deoxyribosyltransferase
MWIRLYIASSLANTAACNRLAHTLEGHKTVITSAWHKDAVSRQDPNSFEERARICAANLFDIRSSDGLVFLPIPNSRGSLLEVGYALGRQMPVFAVGNPLGETLMANGCTWVADERALIELLAT